MPLVNNDFEKFRLFTHAAGKATGDDLIITAHGGFLGRQFDHKIKGPALVFYCPIGYNLLDPGLAAVMEGTVKPRETFNLDGWIPNDYELSKYQGRHGSPKETYASIRLLEEKLIENKYADFAHAAKLQADADKAQQLNRHRALAALQKMIDSHSVTVQNSVNSEVLKRSYDVLTVRNRPFKSDPTLSFVLHSIQNAGYAYKRVHCIFCRGKDGSPSWDPKFN